MQAKEVAEAVETGNKTKIKRALLGQHSEIIQCRPDGAAIR
jgi:hypothetical protein